MQKEEARLVFKKGEEVAVLPVPDRGGKVSISTITRIT